MRVTFAPQAVEDLRIVVGYIAQHSPAAAERLADRVFELVDRLAEGAFDGPEYTLTSGERVRSWPVVPLRIDYQRATDELRILRVYHQKREPIATP